MPKPELSESTITIADKFVSYETHEKGVIGNLFAFEARDGFWSKLLKTIGPVTASLGSASLAFTLVSGLIAGPVVAGIAATVMGLASWGINRAVNESVFSDLHDSHKGNLGKIFHYLAIGIVSGLATTAIYSFLPSLGIVAASATTLVGLNVVNPLLDVFTSKSIAAGFGDQQLRNDSANAKLLAQQAMQSGLSIEQLLKKGQSVKQAPDCSITESPEQSQGKAFNFTQMIEEQRANPQKQYIA